MKTRHTGQRILATEGFTLLEVLVAISILTIGIMAMYSMQLAAVHTNYLGGSVTQSGNFTSSQVEENYSLQYSDKMVSRNQQNKAVRKYDNTKVDGSDATYGVDPDTTRLSNGLQKDFGLNRTGLNRNRQAESAPDQQPDQVRTTDDGRFRVSYNVVEDLPIKGIKKIRVHTLDTGTAMENPVSFDLLKNDNI